MIIFILIFFAMVIVVAAAAVAGFSIYLKRRDKSLDTTDQKQIDDTPPYRSLFAPTDEDVRASEREAQMKFEAERREVASKIAFEKSEKAREFERVWRGKPTAPNTVEFLRLAAESEDAEIFSRTAEKVIQVSLHNEQAGGLSKKDLADLLDSHLRILPQQERFSGAIFWLKQEIETLRRRSE